MSARLPKSERICSERRIEALFAKGRRGGAGPVSYRLLVEEPASPEVEKGAEETAGVVKSGIPAESGGVAVMFSVPKKIFKRAWKRNLIKRRMRESYRQRKEALTEFFATRGLHLDIAFVCAPGVKNETGKPSHRQGKKGEKNSQTTKKPKHAQLQPVEIPDFKTIDNAIAKILEQIIARS